MEIIPYILFIVINLFVVGSSIIMSFLGLGGKVTNFMKFLVMVSAFVFSLITVSEILLGAVGLLSLQWLLIFHFVFFVGLLLGVSYYIKEREIVLQFDEIFLKVDWMLVAAVFSPIVMIGIVRFFNATLQVPIEYDNLAYHLPFVVEWMHSGSLMEVYYSAFAGPLGYYPSNFELLDLWVMLPFHSDILVNLINIPVALVTGVVLYAVCRNFAVSHKPSLLVVALFFMLPVTLRQFGTPLVDLYFCMTFLYSIYFLQEYWKKHTWVYVLLFALSLGLFMGTKYLGVVYSIPLMLIAGGLILRFVKSPARLGKHLGVLVLGILLTGSFFYVRNWIDSGNPLFPTDVSIAGVQIFAGYDGITDNLVETSLASNIPSARSFQFFIEGIYLMIGAPGILFMVGILGLLAHGLLALVGSFSGKVEQRKDALATFLMAAVLVGLLAFYAIMYWISPYSFKDLLPNVRYALMFILIGLVAFGIVMTRFKAWQPFFFFASFFAIFHNIVYLILFPPLKILINERVVLDLDQVMAYLPFAGLFVLLVYGVILIIMHLRTALFQKSVATLLVLLSLSLSFLGFVFFQETAQARENLRGDLYISWYRKNREWMSLLHAVQWFDLNAMEARIAYTGFNMHYPFFGRNLIRDVDYININDCRGCAYKDFKDSPDSIRRDPNFDQWYANIKESGKTHVVVKRLLSPVMYEYDWMKDKPELFEERFSMGDVSIFEVRNVEEVVAIGEEKK